MSEDDSTDGGSDGPEYATISPAEEKDREDYTYIERRAELYRMLKKYGHPRNIEMKQTELAKRYNVDQAQISRDFKRLREYFRARAGDRTIGETEMLGEKVVEEIIDQAQDMKDTAEDLEAAGDFRAAAKMRERAADLWSKAQDNQMQLNEFLFDTGQLEEEPDKVEMDVDPSEAYMQALKQKE